MVPAPPPAKKPSFSVFWSWQSDSPPSENKDFIGKCLKKAAKLVAKAEGFVIDIDRDVRGVGGSPSIADTILKKIRAADVFVFDGTLVYREPRPAPNPNVALEYGYALAVLGENRVIGVMNVAGLPKNETPPFDFQHRRWPIDYELSSNATVEQREAAESTLIETLRIALGAALKEPKSGAMRADTDLKAAMRLWQKLFSAELQGWATFRLGIDLAHEHKSQIAKFREYLDAAALPENQFTNEELLAAHDRFRQALRSHIALCMREMGQFQADPDMLVVSSESTSEKLGRELDEAHWQQQVDAIGASIKSIVAAWTEYAREVASRYPEVVDEAGTPQ